MDELVGGDPAEVRGGAVAKGIISAEEVFWRGVKRIGTESRRVRGSEGEESEQAEFFPHANARNISVKEEC